ncbi:MAG: polymerase, sigma-24 subunit, subfamily [Actinomycetia bacterium]|nr:polymerase, sigma-24 subunit, subfamily [Actinomycetes bacterium]
MPLEGQDGRSGQNAPDPSDIDLRLVTLATAGDAEAFDELYRRHAPVARRVAWSVLRDDGDADDAVAEAFERLLRVIPADRLHDRRAFRAYLLVTTRNLALDAARRRGRGDGWDEALEDLVSAEVVEADADQEEEVLVRRAFAGLPERWRAVLWLTEVESLAHLDVAGLLGISTNAVGQLAARARAGLRECFLQVHVDGPAPEACRFARERLAAHAGGALRTAEAGEVDEHLAGCADCRDRFAEVVDLADTLRRVGVPIGLVLGVGSLSGGALTAGSRLHLSLIARRAVLGVGGVAAAVGLVLGVGVVTRDDPRPGVIPSPVVVVTTLVVPSSTSSPTTSVPTTSAPTTVPPPPATTTTTVPVRSAAVPTTRRPVPSTSTTAATRGSDDDRGDGHRCDRPSRYRCRHGSGPG